ncbi:uric acid degradation bifunctional protein TTL isoform X3 [Syzygium oleosum]|uniref:uric acid degradation bifunctional protein TTL isoform X3 n=1 Tax=Syzygium oleosum TaxID=219896 RepID=UPI0024B99362|nr:uric acid degradation bifunctional protein TTL isoform X3 [Syzygium oleosum]
MEFAFDEKDFLACCGSTRFAAEMARASPFPSFQAAVPAARDIWFNRVDVSGWLEAFSAHPQIGETKSVAPGRSDTSAQWSKGEQSTALATATGSSLQELSDWNVRYKRKFGFIFIICASGRTSPEILAELKRRYSNRPIEEFQIAAEEQMKVTELRLAKLFSAKEHMASTVDQRPAGLAKKAEEVSSNKTSQSATRTRPPITTHVLDVSQGCPASGMEVCLEMWRGNKPRPLFGEAEVGGWILQGVSSTDKDGRSGQLMDIINEINPGIYRISFNTSKYCPGGFFPYVSIIFEIAETQKREHFHVPLLFSPFSFTTYRGS